MTRPQLDRSLLPLAALGFLLAPIGCATEDPTGGTFTTFTSGDYTTLGDGDGDGDETGTGDGDGDGDTATDTDDPPPNCGDGVVDPDEECDLGDMNSDSGQCTAACTIATCGDGKVYEGFEECDDGNPINTDDCTAMCNAAVCGDGYTQEGVEECDDGNDDDADGCTTACVTGMCGDGIVQEGEQCDDGNVITTDDCPACQLAFCGDSYIQAGVEECDDGNMESNDECTSPFCEPATCGDGLLYEGVEECDDGNLDDTDDCPTSCIPAFCGDGFVQAGVEDCDDANMVDDDFCQNDCTGNGYYDDFESNDLNTLPWSSNGSAMWATANTQPHEGSYVAASGTITHSQQSNLQVTLNVPQAGEISFWYRVSSEGSFDYLRFYIDNVQQGNGWSGTVAWAQATYPVGAGNHTFRWTYSKDGSVNTGSDKVWIDEVFIGIPP